LKKWMQVLVNQFVDSPAEPGADGGRRSNDRPTQYPGDHTPYDMTEEKATLLHFLDVWNKHLFEIEGHPVRKTRETLDNFAREIVQADPENLTRVLFRFRQFWGGYRVDEYSYLHKTFDEFRNIIWDFVDQLAEDVVAEKDADSEIRHSLENLKEAVESNSIHALKTQSRHFIDSYVELQSKKEKRKTKRLQSMKQNLEVVKKELVDAQNGMRRDHLTGAFNRKSFDERVRSLKNMCDIEGRNVSLLMLDIDHFKSVNDRFGHANGDYVLIETVKMLNEVFHREQDLVARVGGEEFAVLLPDFDEASALIKAQQANDRIRREALVKDDLTIKFTISIGIAQLRPNESVDDWMKRADAALYFSKNNGRNRCTKSSELGPRRETA